MTLLTVDDLDTAFAKCVKGYNDYIVHNQGKDEKLDYGCMLRFYSAKLESIYDIIVHCYQHDMITEAAFVDCTKVYLDYNDDLLSLYYDVVRG